MAGSTKNAILFVILLVLVGAMFLQPWGCANTPDSPTGQPSTNLRTVKMRIGSRDFTLEVANSEALRQKGLMFRKSMPMDHGMLFIFAKPLDLDFWMKNTLIPLDIIYLDENGIVDSVHQMKPMDLSPIYSDGEAKYAIELNQGVAAKVGVKKGDHLQIPPDTGVAKD